MNNPLKAIKTYKLKSSYFTAWLLILGLLSLYILLTVSLLMKNPPVWPDEAIYAASFKTITGTILPVSELKVVPDWAGLLAISHSAFFYLLKTWFSFVPFSIFFQRLLSSIAGLFFLVAYFWFLRLQGKKSSHFFLDLVIAFSLMVDAIFLSATRISRPEIFVLFFGFLSLCFYIQAMRIIKKNTLFVVLISAAGFFSGISFMIHFFGLFFFVAICIDTLSQNTIHLFKSKEFKLFILGFLVPVVVWFYHFHSHIAYLQELLTLSAVRKSVDKTWLWWVFQHGPVATQLTHLFYVSVSIFFLIYILLRHKKEYYFVGVLLILTFLFTSLGKTHWYFVYVIPFVYVCLKILLTQLTNRGIRRGVFLALGVLILLNLRESYLLTSIVYGSYSYKKYGDALQKIIPEKSTIFLSAIPDPYFVLMSSKKQYRLYEFPALPTRIENYRRVLNESNYIVYTGSYEEMLFNSTLKDYIKSNAAQIIKVGYQGEYQAFVIKLKDYKDRK